MASIHSSASRLCQRIHQFLCLLAIENYSGHCIGRPSGKCSFSNLIHTLALINPLIQYSYQELPAKFCAIAKQKSDQRISNKPNGGLLAEKVNFDYDRINIEKITFKWIAIMNMQFYRGRCKFCQKIEINAQTDPEHARKHISDFIKTDLYELYTLLLTSNNVDISQWDEIIYAYCMTVWE